MTENYKQIAKDLDERFPDFFDKHRNHLNKYYYTLLGPMFMHEGFIQKYYPEIYINSEFDIMHAFNVFSFLGEYTDDFPAAWEKSKTFDDFFNYFLEKNYISEQPYKKTAEEKPFEKTRFDNYFYDGYENILKPKEKHAMLKFTQGDERRISLIYCDFELKTKMLFECILSEDVLPEYNRELINDYVKLCDSVLENKYLIGSNYISLKEAAKFDKENWFYKLDNGVVWDVSLTSEHLAKLFFLCISSRALFIMYNYWLIEKNNNAFKKLLILMYLRIMFIVNDEEIDFLKFEEDFSSIDRLLNFSKYKEIINKNDIEIVDKIYDAINEFYDNSCSNIRKMNSELKDSLKDYSDSEIKSVLYGIPELDNYNLPFIAEENYDDLYYKIDKFISRSIYSKYRNPNQFIKPIDNVDPFAESWKTNFLSTLRIESNKYNYKQKFKNNRFFEKLELGKGDIEISEDNWVYNLPGDMNFEPYFRNETRNRITEKVYNAINYVSKKLLYLGICLEDVFVLNFAICRSDYDDLKDFDFDSLIAKIQKRVYGNKNAKLVKEELNKLSGDYIEMQSFKKERDINWRFINYINLLLNECDSVDELLIEKHKIIESMMQFGINGEKIQIIENISDKISEKIVELKKGDEKFAGMQIEVKAKLNELIKSSREIAYKVYDGKIDEFDNEMNKVISYIVTGELLYDSYAKGSDDRKLDYGCMAIVYYKALECITNYLFYKPYYFEMLANRNPSNNEDEKGYCGDSYKAIVYKRDNTFYYKDSLEYGVIAYLFSHLSKKDIYKNIVVFFNNKGIDINKLKKFFTDMSETTRFRNDCAHSEITDSSCVRKARIITYEDFEKTDDIAIKIKELIFRISEVISLDKKGEIE